MQKLRRNWFPRETRAANVGSFSTVFFEFPYVASRGQEKVIGQGIDSIEELECPPALEHPGGFSRKSLTSRGPILVGIEVL